MSSASRSSRPLSCLKQSLRQIRQQRRHFASAAEQYPSLATRYPPTSPAFRTGQAIKQNRNKEAGMKKIRVEPPQRSTAKAYPDPVSWVTEQQLKGLDSTGARTRLFSRDNVDRAKVGDILHVRFKSSEPFSGVCMVIRKRNSPIDSAILLRNQLTRVGVEMWVKIYSPNVESIEVVQRSQRKVRRAKLYYMRKPKHDLGSVENVVKQYLRQKLGGTGNRVARGSDARSGKKKKR